MFGPLLLTLAVEGKYEFLDAIVPKLSPDQVCALLCYKSSPQDEPIVYRIDALKGERNRSCWTHSSLLFLNSPLNS